MAKNDFKIGSRVRVDVLHINDPHSFYVRPRAYNKYLPILHALGARPDITDINTGEVFTYRSMKMNSIVRGKIIACEKRREEVRCTMFAMDFGYIEEGVTRDRIWNTDYSLQVEPLVTHCKLDGCAPAGAKWDQDVINAMRANVTGKKSKVIIQRKKRDRMVVQLYTKGRVDIRTLLAEEFPKTTKMVPFDESDEDDVKELEQYFPPREVQIGEMLNVTLQSGSLFRRFYVLPIEKDEKFNAERDRYTAYAELQAPLKIQDLSINSPVGVFYYRNLKYERGLVQELLPQFNRARVLMIDLGIITESSVLRMKKVPDWFLSVPMKSLCCTLHGSQIFSNLLTALSEPGVEFQMYIKSIADEAANCPHVIRLTALDDD